MFTLYFHPACYTSYRLLRALNDKNMISSLKLVDMSTNSYLAISKRILTVPLIENEGRQVYGGPIDIYKALALLSRENVTLNVEDVRQALISAIADSAAISAILYSYGSIKPVKEFGDFLNSATGIELDPMYKERIEELNRIIENDDKIYSEIEGKMIATLAYNKVRESIYMDINDHTTTSFVSWFVSKSSIGRAGVPFYNVNEIKQKALKIYQYYIERKERIEEKLLNEINEIKNGINEIV